MAQFSDWLAPPRSSALLGPQRLLSVVMTAAYPTLALVAFAGGSGGNVARRAFLYRIYLAGTAAYIGAVAYISGQSWPTSPSEPLWLHLGGLLLFTFLNLPAVWIGGRWVIYLLFPKARPGPRVTVD